MLEFRFDLFDLFLKIIKHEYAHLLVLIFMIMGDIIAYPSRIANGGL